jgi:FixJ family two-component response regulator
MPFLRSVGRLLRSAGFATATFSSGREFLAALPGLAPGCVLVDVHMPEMTGLQLQERLAESGFRFPLIFITAYDSPQTREHAQREGCAGLLLKPFERQTLFEAIWRALGKSSDPAKIQDPAVTLR